MKEQKGITLIALIITIIVMLILVAVTINVALNGGIFDKAEDAKTKTQKEVDKEMLLSAVVATVDNNGNFHLDQIVTPEGFEKVSTSVYKNTATGKQYKIDSTTGKVTEYNGAGEETPAGTYNAYMTNVNIIKTIILNDDGQTGKVITEGEETEEQSIIYNYSEDDKTLALEIDEDEFEFEFKVIGNNKVLFIMSSGLYMVYTTEGVSNIAPLEGTYGEGTDTMTFNADGTFTSGEYNGIYCVIDNYLYEKIGGNFYMFDATPILQN